MQTGEIGGYRLLFDAAATTAAYLRVAVPGPEKCACWYCRNWIAGRDFVVHGEVRSLLRRYGVPVNGEIEVWEVPGVRQPHGYGGWYTVVGNIVEMPSEHVRDFQLGVWQVRFSPERSYVVSAFSDLSVFEIHFFVETGKFLDSEPE